MFFPEFLYQLSPKDQQVSWLDPYVDLQTLVNTPVTNVVNAQPAPIGRALLLQHVLLTGNPGGSGDNVTGGFISLVDPPGASRGYLRELTGQVIAANVSFELHWFGSLIVLPGWTIRGSITKNAAVNLITVRMSVMGVIIPIGNLQRI
jgi:hypothetical protein